MAWVLFGGDDVEVRSAGLGGAPALVPGATLHLYTDSGATTPVTSPAVVRVVGGGTLTLPLLVNGFSQVPLFEAVDTADLWYRVNAGPVARLYPNIGPFLDDVSPLVAAVGDGSSLVVQGDELINVRAAPYSATGDGTTDDTTAVRAALAAAVAAKKRLYFPAGTYLITDSLTDGDAFSTGYLRWSWAGERSERGTGGYDLSATYAASVIKFRPVDTAKPLYRVYSTNSPASVIGPYEHADLTFDLGGANGPVLGVEDHASPTTLDPASPPAMASGTGQRYVFSPRFVRCAFSATFANRASVAGVITRSGRKLIRMAKCFEAVLEDVSMFGGDVQIRGLGCDRPVLSRVRSQGAHLPIDFASVTGTDLGVHHALNDVQVEGWTFGAMRTYAVPASVFALRVELNDGAPVGGSRFALSATAAVTADSGTLTFSSSMTGILWPRLSLIEVTDGTHTVTALVETVSGTTVAVNTDAIVFTWSAAAATVTRIHGYGLLHIPLGAAGHALDVVGSSMSVGSDCPATVLHPLGDGRVRMSDVTSEYTADDHHSIVAANRVGKAFQTDVVMEAVSCDPRVAPDPTHPLVRVDNQRGHYGAARVPAVERSIAGETLADSVAQVRRQWAWTPKSPGQTANSDSISSAPIVQLADGTGQLVWAWHKRVTGNLILQDTSVPSSSSSKIRVRIRARAATGTMALPWVFAGTAGTTGPAPTLTTAPTTYEYILPMPAAWQGARSDFTPGVWFTGSGYYLLGVAVEEIDGSEMGLFPGGVATRSKAGIPADADWVVAPPDNTMVVDSTNNRLYVRVGGTWKFAALT